MPLVGPPTPSDPRDEQFWQAAHATMERACTAAGVRSLIRATREEYERACQALELTPWPDEVCDSPEISDGRHGPPEHDFATTIERRMAQYRGWGIKAERHRARLNLRDELAARFPRGTSRTQYEQVCVEYGVEPAPDERIRSMSVEYHARVEIEALPDFGLFLAPFRDIGIRRETNPH